MMVIMGGVLGLGTAYQATLVVGTRAEIAAYQVTAVLAHFTVVVVVILRLRRWHVDCNIRLFLCRTLLWCWSTGLACTLTCLRSGMRHKVTCRWYRRE
jgi:hypothetical protein